MNGIFLILPANNHQNSHICAITLRDIQSVYMEEDGWGYFINLAAGHTISGSTTLFKYYNYDTHKRGAINIRRRKRQIRNDI